MEEDISRSDLVLSNGAVVEFKLAKDATGAAVIRRLEVWIPAGTPIPLGGITANTLREIPLSTITSSLASNWRSLELSREQEDLLVHRLRNYPRRPGRSEVPQIFLAATAYFFEKFLNEWPHSPHQALAKMLGVPVETIRSRVNKARSKGFLTTGATRRSGGRARGSLSEMARIEIERYLKDPANVITPEIARDLLDFRLRRSFDLYDQTSDALGK